MAKLVWVCCCCNDSVVVSQCVCVCVRAKGVVCNSCICHPPNAKKYQINNMVELSLSSTVEYSARCI